MTTPHLSESVINELSENPAAAWSWFSEQFAARQRAQNPDHLLVRIAARFDFRAVEQVCAGYRVYAGARGQEAAHIVVRDFVGYRLGQRPMSHAKFYHVVALSGSVGAPPATFAAWGAMTNQ